MFLTNNFEVEAMEVSPLYKNRWQVEVLFKWIKQNLQIKTIGVTLKMLLKSIFGQLFAPTW